MLFWLYVLLEYFLGGLWFVAPFLVLCGPSMVILLFGAIALSLAIVLVGKATTWISVGVWLIYIRGIVVIFLFFLSRAPNATPYSIYAKMGGGLILGGFFTKESFLARSPIMGVFSGILGGHGGFLIWWVGGVLILILLISRGGGVTQPIGLSGQSCP